MGLDGQASLSRFLALRLEAVYSLTFSESYLLCGTMEPQELQPFRMGSGQKGSFDLHALAQEGSSEGDSGFKWSSSSLTPPPPDMASAIMSI